MESRGAPDVAGARGRTPNRAPGDKELVRRFSASIPRKSTYFDFFPMPSTELFSFALTALVTLFVTIGPIEGAAIYTGLTSGIHASERGRLAWRSVLIAG